MGSSKVQKTLNRWSEQRVTGGYSDDSDYIPDEELKQIVEQLEHLERRERIKTALFRDGQFKRPDPPTDAKNNVVQMIPEEPTDVENNAVEIIQEETPPTKEEQNNLSEGEMIPEVPERAGTPFPFDANGNSQDGEEVTAKLSPLVEEQD